MSDHSTADQAQLLSALESKLKKDPGAKETFCKCWPCAHAALELLSKLPTLPPQIAAAIKIIEIVGDKASGELCK